MQQPTSRPVCRLPRGVTLIESLIVLTSTVVVLGTVAPGFHGLRERHQVEGAAAQLETDLMHARGLAVAQNRTLRLEFDRNEHGSCYVVHTGTAGQCRCAPGGAVCDNGVQTLRSVLLPAGEPLSVASNVRSLVFDAVKGTVTPTATMKVQGRGGVAIHQVINIMGRVRSCTPDGAIRGLKSC
jgi:type IV fimbrial biogenesis protein FimT